MTSASSNLDGVLRLQALPVRELEAPKTACIAPDHANRRVLGVYSDVLCVLNALSIDPSKRLMTHRQPRRTGNEGVRLQRDSPAPTGPVRTIAGTVDCYDDRSLLRST